MFEGNVLHEVCPQIGIVVNQQEALPENPFEECEGGIVKDLNIEPVSPPFQTFLFQKEGKLCLHIRTEHVRVYIRVLDINPHIDVPERGLVDKGTIHISKDHILFFTESPCEKFEESLFLHFVQGCGRFQ